MSLFVAWVVYPLVLVALCAGLGLLVDLLSGRRLPGALVVPVGFAAMIVIGEFTTATDATAELTVPVVISLAVVGAGLSIPWRFGRPDPLPAFAAIAVFLVFGAPVILSGEPTFAGYIKLDDTATWLAMTDRIMEHGRSLEGLNSSSYLRTLEVNLAAGYPIGAFIPFGTAQKFVGGDLAWVFQPYLSFLVAMLSLSLWELLGVVRRPRIRAAATFIAAQPALLFGYAMWGGIKEVVAAALVALGAALAPAVVREGARPRDVLPLAIAAAALVEVLSPGGILWLGPLLLALAVLAYRQFGLRAAAGRAVLFSAVALVSLIPIFGSGLVPPTSKSLVGSDGEGNLFGPLNPLQVLGIWPAGDFRVDPDSTVATAVLIGLGILAVGAGLWGAWRRRAVGPLLYASALIACAAIVVLGSPWAAAKALATASPIALTLAVLGALAMLRLDRVAGGLLVIVVAGGVLWSNVLAYGGVSLAPYDKLVELEEIGDRFAGQGPTLMTEYNPYGARHFLRNLDGEGASELRVRTVPLRAGGSPDKGEPVDTDELTLNGLLEFRTLVLRRSPVRSRPPSPYQLVYSGEDYEVWQRPAAPSVDFEHEPYGERFAGVGTPNCDEIQRLVERPGQDTTNVRLLAARHAPFYYATDGSFDVPRPGRYVAWLKGEVRGLDELYVDGEKFGEARHRIENEGGFIEMGEGQLSAGSHKAELRFGGADLHPGSGGFPRPQRGPLIFAPVGGEHGELVSVSGEDFRRLCGKPWDWIEAFGSDSGASPR